MTQESRDCSPALALRFEIQDKRCTDGDQRKAQPQEWIRRDLGRMQVHREEDVHKWCAAEYQRHHIRWKTTGAERVDDEHRAERSESPGQCRLRESARVPALAELALRRKRHDRHEHADKHVRQADAEQRTEWTAEFDLTGVKRGSVHPPRDRRTKS